MRILKDISILRTRLKLAFTSFDFFVVDLYEAISRHTDVDVRDLHGSYTVGEMIELVSGAQISPAQSALARFHQGSLAKLSMQEANTFWPTQRISFDHQTVNPHELRGTTANAGTCDGKVHILNCNDSAKANYVRQVMADGDVLVSEMIQFNVIDLVQRAGALITDEGGMLSHAAILARELGIPCIVGTQKATQYLRDGDMVRVGQRGLVQVISD